MPRYNLWHRTEFYRKYPPAKPVALRLLAPQMGLTAIEKTFPVPLSATLPNHSVYPLIHITPITLAINFLQAIHWDKSYTPGIVKLWESPQQSCGFSLNK